MAETIAATATRRDGWWSVMVDIPDHTSYTQGKTLKEARRMAEDIVRLWADELHDDSLSSAAVDLKVVGTPHNLVEEYLSARLAAEQVAKKAQEKQIDTVATLRSQGLTVQDVADLMGISKGRVSQIA